MSVACAFLRTLRKLVDDCSNPVQLRHCMNKFSHYIYIKETREVFFNRISELSHDGLKPEYDPVLEDLHDACDDGLDHPIRAFSDIDTSFIYPNLDIDCPFEKDILKRVFKVTNGNKVDICDILGLSNEDLNNKINRYKLKELLNIIRKNYREGKF